MSTKPQASSTMVEPQAQRTDAACESSGAATDPTHVVTSTTCDNDKDAVLLLKQPEEEEPPLDVHDDDDDDDDDSSIDEDEYPHLFQSMRSSTGLEVGVRVTWPGTQPMELSTRLPAHEIAPMFHGTQWAGTRVWKAAIVALQYLLEEALPKRVLSSQFSCLELGCGLGVPGMILHALHPTSSRVVLTDCAALLDQLQGNVARNFPDHANRLTAATLDWDEPGDLTRLLESSGISSFDVVLNCDCIYEPLYGTSWKSLLKVQVALLQRQPNALVLTSLERRKFDGADKYLAALEQEPLVTKVELVHQDDPVEIYRVYGE